MELSALFRREELEKPGWARRIWPCWCFLALILLALAPLLIDVMPQRDVAFRYVPMAEAFRDGDFVYAFHPRTGFLHTFTAGLFAWVFRCSGFTACKMSSLLFMGLCLFPLYGLMKRVFSRTMAELCCFMFVVGSQLHRLAWSGLRDSHKAFLLVTAAYALILIYQERKKWQGYLYLGAATGLGMITRGDLVLNMLLLFFWGIVMEWKLKKIPYRSIASAFLALVLAMPSIVLNWYLAGVAVPEIRFAWIFRKLMHRYPGLPDTLPMIAAGLFCGFFAAWVLRKIIDAGYGWIPAAAAALGLTGLLVWGIRRPDFYVEGTVLSYFGAIFKGFFPVFAVTGLIGIYYRITRKKWTREESILAAVLYGNAVLVCMQIILYDTVLYVSSRYLLPGVPMELGWSAIGVLFWWSLLSGPFREKYPKLVHAVGFTAFVVTVCFFLFDFYSPVITEYGTRKWIRYRQGLNEIASVIRKNYHGPAEFRPQVDPNLYIPKRNPGVLFMKYKARYQDMWTDSGRVLVSAFLAGGRIVYTIEDADFIVEERTDRTDFLQYVKKNWKNVKLEFLADADTGKARYRIWKKRN